jgi:hypothetical protein
MVFWTYHLLLTRYLWLCVRVVDTHSTCEITRRVLRKGPAALSSEASIGRIVNTQGLYLDKHLLKSGTV